MGSIATQPVISNSIFYSNTAPRDPQIYGSPTVQYSCVQGGYSGTGNIFANPSFVDPSTGDFSLDVGSSCIDAGNNDLVPSGSGWDFYGRQRFFDDPGVPDTGAGIAPIVDMGASEAGAPDFEYILYVDGDNGDDSNFGFSWGSALQTLQPALDKAATAEGAEVWVKAGIYKPDSTDPNISFEVPDHIYLYGGFSGTETSIDQRDWEANPTILSGKIGDPASDADNTNGVVALNSATIDGFIIEEGNSPYIGGGGGMKLLGTEMEISNCLFRNNKGREGAAASLFNLEHQYSLSFTNCRFENSEAEYHGPARGGAVSIYSTGPSGSASFTSCVFQSNTATSTTYHAYGGAVSLYSKNSTQVSLSNCLFLENSTVTQADGRFSRGGGINIEGKVTPSVTNCTFFNNSASSTASSPGYRDGGAILHSTISTPLTIKNSILFNNSASRGAEICNFDPTTMYNSCMEGGINGPKHDGMTITDGGGNISSDPQFVNFSYPVGADGVIGTIDDGLQLRKTSPCVNSGLATGAPAEDLLGVSRPQGSGVDMGVYEYINYAPSAQNANAQTDEDVVLAESLSVEDLNSDSLNFTLVDTPIHGNIVIDDTSAGFTYTPGPDFNGEDSFSWYASDGISQTETVTTTITVNPVNDPPFYIGGPVRYLTRPGQTDSVYPRHYFRDPDNATIDFNFDLQSVGNYGILPFAELQGPFLIVCASTSVFGTTTVTVRCFDPDGLYCDGEITFATSASVEGQAVEFKLDEPYALNEPLTITTTVSDPQP